MIQTKMPKNQPSMIPRRVAPPIVNFVSKPISSNQLQSKTKKPSAWDESGLLAEQKEHQLTQTLMQKLDFQDHADETLQDISSSLSEEEVKELREDLRFATQEEQEQQLMEKEQEELKQNLAERGQKPVQAEMDSIAQSGPLEDADSMIDLVNELKDSKELRPEMGGQQSDQLVDEIQMLESNVEAEIQANKWNEDDDEEDEEEKVITAKFIGVKADELDKQTYEKDERNRLSKSISLESRKESFSSSAGLSNNKRSRLSEMIERFSKEEDDEAARKLGTSENQVPKIGESEIEYSEKRERRSLMEDVPASPLDFEKVHKPAVLEPVITVKNPSLERQTSIFSERSILRKDSKGSKPSRSKTQTEDRHSSTEEKLNRSMMNGPRRSSVVRFANSTDDDFEQAGRIYNKTSVHQFSLERAAALNNTPDQEKEEEEELIVQVESTRKDNQVQDKEDQNVKQDETEKTDKKMQKNFSLTPVEKEQSASKSVTDEEEVTIEEEATVDDKDSSLDQALASDEETMRQQLKREKLQLIENIEREIRENLENESKQDARRMSDVTPEGKQKAPLLTRSKTDLFRAELQPVRPNLLPDEPRSE